MPLQSILDEIKAHILTTAHSPVLCAFCGMAKTRCGICSAGSHAKQGTRVQAYQACDLTKVKATMEQDLHIHWIHKFLSDFLTIPQSSALRCFWQHWDDVWASDVSQHLECDTNQSSSDGYHFGIWEVAGKKPQLTMEMLKSTMLAIDKHVRPKGKQVDKSVNVQQDNKHGNVVCDKCENVQKHGNVTEYVKNVELYVSLSVLSQAEYEISVQEHKTCPKDLSWDLREEWEILRGRACTGVRLYNTQASFIAPKIAMVFKQHTPKHWTAILKVHAQVQKHLRCSILERPMNMGGLFFALAMKESRSNLIHIDWNDNQLKTGRVANFVSHSWESKFQSNQSWPHLQSSFRSAFSIFEKAYEDFPCKMDVEISGMHPLDYMIPKFLGMTINVPTCERNFSLHVHIWQMMTQHNNENSVSVISPLMNKAMASHTSKQPIHIRRRHQHPCRERNDNHPKLKNLYHLSRLFHDGICVFRLMEDGKPIIFFCEPPTNQDQSDGVSMHSMVMEFDMATWRGAMCLRHGQTFCHLIIHLVLHL
ncbi:hypothetical protein BDR05DRAFT_943716 [Suillus weaverae]|nr:hypothetical protein BDR05DRAFT_943716 [Suillus weaverae]